MNILLSRVALPVLFDLSSRYLSTALWRLSRRSATNRSIALVYGLLWCGALPILGAPAKPAPSAQGSRSTAIATPPSSYRLGPGDVLRITAEEYPQFSNDNVVILSDGSISLPVYGRLQVGGKTVPQVQAELRKRLAKRLIDPRVTVIIVRPREVKPNYIYVLGDAVKSPGSVVIREGYRLTEVLAAVGGVVGRLNEVKAILTRRGQSAVAINLHEAVSRPSSPINRRVMPNDVLTITTVDPGQITVIGAVTTPGAVKLRPGFRITDVVAAVGGMPGRADEKQATLTHAGQQPISVDLAAAMAQPASAANLRVAAGDVLTVAEVSPGRITVDGDVARPGVYELKRAPRPNSFELGIQPRLSDALIASGGLKSETPGDEAAANSAYTGYILRNNQKIPIQVAAAISFEEGAANPELQPDDIVRVAIVPPVIIYVDGLVKNPGSTQLTPGAGVIEAVYKAGGLTQPADKVVAAVRRGNELMNVDLNRALTDAAANVMLRNGDVLLINLPKTIAVQLTGRIAKPDTLRLPPAATLLDAITEAGGPTVDIKEARITILRTLPNGQRSTLAIDPVALLNHDQSQNARLQEGDFITVSEVKKRIVSLSGEVARQGPYELKAGDGLAEVITQAGGATPEAALARVVVERNGVSNTVDIYPALVEGTPVNFPLQEGDFIVVPKNNKRVLVMEAVKNPGYVLIPEKRDLTVLEAIGMAGGTLPNNKTREVVVLRQTATGVEKRVIPYGQLRTGKANEILKDRDVVLVPPVYASQSFLSKATQSLGILGFLGL